MNRTWIYRQNTFFKTSIKQTKCLKKSKSLSDSSYLDIRLELETIKVTIGDFCILLLAVHCLILETKVVLFQEILISRIATLFRPNIHVAHCINKKTLNTGFISYDFSSMYLLPFWAFYGVCVCSFHYRSSF